MEISEVRLECLKLAHTHGRSSAEAVERAKDYEKYILGHQDRLEQTGEEVPKKTTRQQKAGNSNT